MKTRIFILAQRIITLISSRTVLRHSPHSNRAKLALIQPCYSSQGNRSRESVSIISRLLCKDFLELLDPYFALRSLSDRISDCSLVLPSSGEADSSGMILVLSVIRGSFPYFKLGLFCTLKNAKQHTNSIVNKDTSPKD